MTIQISKFDWTTFNTIKILLKNHPKLLWYIFNQDPLCLKSSSLVLLEESNDLSSGEKVLIKLALDIWDNSGNAKFTEVINLLSKKNLTQVKEAFSLIKPWPF